MTISANALRKLAALNLNPEQMAGVLEMLAEQQEAEETRKAAQRERTRRSRAGRDGNVTDTLQSQDSNVAVPPKKETSPTPPKEKTTPSISEATASSFAALVDQGFEIWDSMAQSSGLATVRVRSQPRRSKLGAVIRQHGMEVWQEACRRVGASSFCRGEKGDGWKADLDFVLQAKSFGRILEGHYDDRARGSPPTRQPANGTHHFHSLAQETTDEPERTFGSNQGNWDDAGSVSILTIEDYRRHG